MIRNASSTIKLHLSASTMFCSANIFKTQSNLSDIHVRILNNKTLYVYTPAISRHDCSHSKSKRKVCEEFIGSIYCAPCINCRDKGAEIDAAPDPPKL